MNDWWNDPPEEPEYPICCDDFCDVMEDGTAICRKCGKTIKPEPEDIYIEEPLYDTIEERDSEKEQFPEDTYDYAQDDLNFDTERERRLK